MITKVAKKSIRSSSGSDNKEGQILKKLQHFKTHMLFKSVVASLMKSFHVLTVSVDRSAQLALSFCEQIYNSEHNERIQRMKLLLLIFPSSPAESSFVIVHSLKVFRVILEIHT